LASKTSILPANVMTSRRHSSAKTTCFTDGEIHDVNVEVMIRNGLQRFEIIGLPQHMIKEGRDRILSTLAHLGIELPAQKILVSLTPGHLRKEGTYFDLPILYAILKGLGVIPNKEERIYLWGELSLRGDIRLFEDFEPHGLYASTKADRLVTNYSTELDKIQTYLPCQIQIVQTSDDLLSVNGMNNQPKPRTQEDIDLHLMTKWMKEDVAEWDNQRGSEHQFLFWSLVILGRHSVLLEGPPGVGKSSWIRALKRMQAPLPRSQWIPTMATLWGQRPYIAPHHSGSKAALVGGGTGKAYAGAISKAHLGILFLDEFAEFSRDAIEAFREPLEIKKISVARSGGEKTFPADTQILAAMNLCRCGRTGSPLACTCTSAQYMAYRTKITEPIRERFDAHLHWTFVPSAIKTEFHSVNVKKKIHDALCMNLVREEEIPAPPHLSPRRQKAWVRFFQTWCRWFQIEKPTAETRKNFEHFLKVLEGTHGD